MYIYRDVYYILTHACIILYINVLHAPCQQFLERAIVHALHYFLSHFVKWFSFV